LHPPAKFVYTRRPEAGSGRRGFRRSLVYNLWLVALAVLIALMIKSAYKRDLITGVANGLGILALSLIFLLYRDRFVR